MDLKAFLDKHKVKASFMGGALIVSTAYGTGTCQFQPELPSVEEAPAEEAPAEEAPEAEEAPADETEASVEDEEE